MTRKRYIKLRMADGLTRNQATIEADAAVLFGPPYRKKLAIKRLEMSKVYQRLTPGEQKAYRDFVLEVAGID